jgi:hypothetical protein
MKYKKVGPWAKAVAKTTGLYQENGVLLIKGKFTKKEVDEFNGKKSISKKKVDEKHSYSNRSSKEDLEEFGRTQGIELDRRKSKKSLLKELKNFLTGKK